MITTLLLALTITTTDTLKWPANEEGMALSEMINDYRKANRKQALRLCDSLNYIASSHAVNLNIWYEDTSLSLYSWVNPREAKESLIPKRTGDVIGSCVKPNEILGMKNLGFEMVHMHVEKDQYCDPECAFKFFLAKPLFRDMIVENDFDSWARMGVVIYKYTASVWFMRR